MFVVNARLATGVVLATASWLAGRLGGLRIAKAALPWVASASLGSPRFASCTPQTATGPPLEACQVGGGEAWRGGVTGGFDRGDVAARVGTNVVAGWQWVVGGGGGRGVRVAPAVCKAGVAD